MEGFLRSFEALTTSWDDNEGRGQCLRGQLTGEAVEVVNRLRIEHSNSYEKMKEALLRRYECNQEGYKRKFYENKPERGESFSMYINRSADYLTNWFKMAKVQQDYESCMDFLVREQLLSICQEDLRVLLKTHVSDNPNAQELAQKADGYAEAKGGVEQVLKRNQVLTIGNLYRNRPNYKVCDQ